MCKLIGAILRNFDFGVLQSVKRTILTVREIILFGGCNRVELDFRFRTVFESTPEVTKFCSLKTKNILLTQILQWVFRLANGIALCTGQWTCG